MRGIILGSLSLLTLIFAAPADAGPEEDALEAMAACRAIAADPVRLACMDAASQLLDDVRRADTSADAPPRIEPLPVPPPAPVIDRAAAAERAALIAEREAIAAEREALATERAAIEAAASAPTPTLRDRGSSLLERLRPTGGEDAKVQIVKIIRRRHSDTLRFVTEEGLIFDQVSSRISFRAPSSLPAQATISFGALSSKWITFDEEPRRKYKVSLYRTD